MDEAGVLVLEDNLVILDLDQLDPWKTLCELIYLLPWPDMVMATWKYGSLDFTS